MKMLLYGICPALEPETIPPVSGLDDRPVLLVASDNLSAVVSQIDGLPAQPRLKQILAYQKVVEIFHDSFTIIPMRYGNVFDNRQQIVCLLKEHNGLYLTLLSELKNYVEMEIRVELKRTKPAAPVPAANKQDHLSGKSYLKAQKSIYILKDKEKLEQDMFKEEITYYFSDFVKTSKAEVRLFAGKPFLFIYFLVARRALNGFRDKFNQIINPDLNPRKSEWPDLYISGPWPPHNFVSHKTFAN